MICLSIKSELLDDMIRYVVFGKVLILMKIITGFIDNL